MRTIHISWLSLHSPGWSPFPLESIITQYVSCDFSHVLSVQFYSTFPWQWLCSTKIYNSPQNTGFSTKITQMFLCRLWATEKQHDFVKITGTALHPHPCKRTFCFRFTQHVVTCMAPCTNMYSPKASFSPCHSKLCHEAWKGCRGATQEGQGLTRSVEAG